MEQGDLALSVRPRCVLIIEGVLCHAIPIERERRWRKPEITGYHIHWYDIPLKRLYWMKERYPTTDFDLVSFISSEFVDEAAVFLNEAMIPFDQIRYQSLGTFLSVIKFQNDLKAVYDSDWDRLVRYGQLGVSVLPGEDW